MRGKEQGGWKGGQESPIPTLIDKNVLWTPLQNTYQSFIQTGAHKRLPCPQHPLFETYQKQIDLMLVKGYLFAACYLPDMGGNGAGSDIKKK